MSNLKLHFPKRALLFAATALLLFSACKHQQESKYHYETVNGDLSETRIYTLDNGLTVYLSVNE